MTVTPFTPRTPSPPAAEVPVPVEETAYVGVVVARQRQLWERALADLREAEALEAEAGELPAPQAPAALVAARDARSSAVRLFQEANDLGTALPLDSNKVCCLTGYVAAGSARPPGYPWDTPLRLSHGRDERWPTALHRWCGYTDPGGHYHPPERPTLRAAVRSGHLVLVVAPVEPHGPRQGGEALRGVYGLRKGDRFRVEFRDDGVAELHPEPRPRGLPG